MQPTEEHTYRQSVELQFSTVDEKLDQIIAQTTKTNGRVAQLELDKAVFDGQINLVKNLLYAFFVILVGSIIVPIISAYIQAGKL